ncbi:MAG: hypothetical protein HKP58_05055 [Desulfatitalea sp.]|nr:hypothetical protein [Desulfatitalea sp.]NNJ99761.1 hypothetical protein [Desulfatitalea sp.]
MKGYNKKRLAVTVLVMIFSMMAVPVFAGQVTLTGMVTDDFQVIDDHGQSYDIAETAKGEEMVEKAAGKTVKVTGTLEEDGDMRTLVVASFTIVAE